MPLHHLHGVMVGRWGWVAGHWRGHNFLGGKGRPAFTASCASVMFAPDMRDARSMHTGQSQGSVVRAWLLRRRARWLSVVALMVALYGCDSWFTRRNPAYCCED